MRTDTPRPIRLKDYTPPAYLIDHVDLDIVLDAEKTRVAARLAMRRNPGIPGPATSRLALDGEGLTLETIRIDGEDLDASRYRITKDSLTIERVPAAFVLETVVTVNPLANKALQGLYLTRGVYCTQCEAEGFRRITYFLDRPDVLSTYKVRIEADVREAGVLLSNGNPLERGTREGGRRHYAVWHDPHPKPCYLFALVGGNLAPVASAFTTMSGRHVDLTIYVEPGKEDRAGWAMESLERAMRWDEERFGREYDLDVFNIVAVSHFNMGAMENKGLNIFNDRLVLASPDKATDAVYQSIEAVVAHEYFHNWTGNRITCRDWFQLCLKEGLTVYRDQEFSAEMRSATVQRIREVRALRTHQFPEDQGPLAHPVRPESYIEINNFYTATVYEKGAEVVRMLHTLLGGDGFKAGMDLYFDRHDGDATTIEHFVACFEEATGRDLEHFARWYHQSGTPRIAVRTAWDAKRRTFTIELAQETPPTPGQAKKKPLYIPVRYGLVGRDGNEIETIPHDDGAPRDRAPSNGAGAEGPLLHLTGKRQKFVFEGLDEEPVASLFRGFSAPVVVEHDRSDADLAFLATHDSDGFNRWQALNTLATRLMLRRIDALKSDAGRPPPEKEFVDALNSALADPHLEHGFKAELLKLPSETDLARDIARNVDPALIHRAHRQFSGFIARRLGDRLEALYADHAHPKGSAFSAGSEAMGRRALRNACLTLLCERGRKDDIERLEKHYRRATNMTDAAHALHLATRLPQNRARPLLDHFYRKWKADHLVIDTWLAAVAGSPRASVLAGIRQAMKDPVFDLYVPNKVRALIGTFATNNPVQFHRVDGAGYRFFADRIIEIDRFNPQLGARLLGAMRAWSSLEAQRRERARTELQRIAQSPNLSRDVYEIVTRMIEPISAD